MVNKLFITPQLPEISNTLNKVVLVVIYFYIYGLLRLFPKNIRSKFLKRKKIMQIARC